MKRKGEKSGNAEFGLNSPILGQIDERFVPVEQRGPDHRRAFSWLEKKFGRAEFSLEDAVRASSSAISCASI